MAQEIEDKSGPIEKWVKPDHTGSTPGSWGSLAVTVASAVERAIELGKREWLNDEHILDDIWGKACRSGVTLQFATRAAQQLDQAIKAGELPEGTRATKSIKADSPILEVQVLNSENMVIGTGDSLENAIRHARLAELANRPYADLTLDQFTEITTVIEVETGRGKTGTAVNGTDRLLFTGISSVSNMRQFLGRAYDLQQREGGIEANMDRKTWVDTSLRSLMANAFDGDVKSLAISGVGHLLLTRNHGIPMQEILATIHKGYVAESFKVTDASELANELTLPETPPPARERLRA